MDESRAKANKTLAENATSTAMASGAIFNPAKFAPTMNLHTDKLAGIYKNQKIQVDCLISLKENDLRYDSNIFKR